MALKFYIDYLKHQLTAKTRHGTHSPFVYKLADEVIYDNSIKKVYKGIEDLRKNLLNDQEIITVVDLGAGSQRNKSLTKSVKSIAKNALKPPHLAQLIYRLAANHHANELVELGTCLGLTTAYLANAKPNARIISMEGCPSTAKIAQRNFDALDLKNIYLQIGNFDELFPEYLKQQSKIDFVYIDGNHTKSATLKYFEWCLEKKHDDTLLIFDDIYWSDGMKEAWEIIKKHPEVTVTIDLFWIGLVYFRKGQAKENFKLRF